MWIKKLWGKTKEVATTYTGTFIVVMALNQLLFFGFCLNPVCLIAAMPHVLLITVIIGTWLNKRNNWGENPSNWLEKANNKAKEFEKYSKGVRIKAHQFSTEEQEKARIRAIEIKREIADAQRIASLAINNKFESRKQPSQPALTSSIESATTCLANYGVMSLWHLTHRDNIPDILTEGILSNTTVFNDFNHAHPVDISDHGAQKWRERPDPHFNRKIHDYTPLYISIRNPMLYRRKELQHELCLVEIAPSVLDNKEFLISDGNASSRDTFFYKSLDKLPLLPWDVLNARFWSDFKDGKRKKCAEVLIHPKIEPKHINRIHCCTDDTARFLIATLGCVNVDIAVSNDLFF